MKRTFRSTLLCAALLTALSVLGVVRVPSLIAQAIINTTTLSADLAAPTQGNPAQRISLTSGSTVAVGQVVYVDTESMTVLSATNTTTQWNVNRGQNGTTGRAHASGAQVFTGPPNYFRANNPVGPCVSTDLTARPYINTGEGNYYDCAPVSTLTGSAAATWARYIQAGYPAYTSDRYTGWVYATAGAITIQPGVQFIGSSGALAMTLAAPAKWQDGLVMVLQASTAQAHTVTYTAGFYGNTTSSDVATFGGAIGDNLVIYATNGAWRIQSLKTVTIG